MHTRIFDILVHRLDPVRFICSGTKTINIEGCGVVEGRLESKEVVGWQKTLKISKVCKGLQRSATKNIEGLP